MSLSELPVQLTGTTLAMEQGFQDGMITRCLPAWMVNLGNATPATDGQPASPVLKPAQWAALQGALKTSLLCRQRLAADLGRLQGIYAYCQPLLQSALRSSLFDAVDSEALRFRHFYFGISPKPEFAAGRLPQQEKNCDDIPLIDAALANFSESEQQALPRSDCLVERDGKVFAQMSASAFARACRKLDLGQRYQDHLASILDAPASQAASGFSLKDTLSAQQASTLLIDACKAHGEGALSAEELALVGGLCTDGKLGTLHGDPVHARQLSVYQCKLEQVVVLEVTGSFLGFSTSRRVLVHLPGDPVSAWNVASDLDVFIRRTLGKRLGDKAYQGFFKRFVRLRDQPRFFARVTDELADVAEAASRDMEQHMIDYPSPLFDHLAQARIAQIKDDAAAIAVPVQVLDREDRLARRHRLISAMWTTVTVASFFVPGVNELLLAAAAWGLLKDVFHAIEEWQEGDTRAALNHVLDIASTVMTYGVTAVAMRAISREWKLVDPLVTARLENGQEKLWRFDLAPFRSAAPPVQAMADEQGIYRQGEQCWVNMDGHFYAVTQRDDQQWQIVPRQGHGPQLRHNGAGAWRVWCEQPIEWHEPRKMFQRLGGEFARLQGQQVDQVLAIHGMDADQLRALLVCTRAPEACLVDTVSRVILANRIQALVNQLRTGVAVADMALLARVQNWQEATGLANSELAERVWARRRSLLQQLYYERYPVTSNTQALMRDFSSLHRLGAEQLLDTGQDDLGLSAAALVRRIRCVRVHEALLFETPQNLDLARVALQLMARLPGAASGPGWQLFDGEGQLPILATEGAAPTLSLRYQGGEFRLGDAMGSAFGEPGELFQTMATGYTREQRAALVIGEPFALLMRAEVARQLMAQQQLIAELLGFTRRQVFFSAPRRLADGRLGYPLSRWRCGLSLTRQRPRNLVAELRDLYPGHDEAAVERWLMRLRLAQRDPAAELLALKQQFSTLSKQLNAWQYATFKTWRWKARREFVQGLVNCWRYLVPRQLGAAEANSRYVLSTFHSDLDELPAIPASVSFPHVTDLALRSLQIRAVPDSFLHAFGALRSLSVTNCRLRSLELAAGTAERLQVLDLSGNQLRQDDALNGVLGRCRSLIYLNLSHNPLQRPLTISHMAELNALMLADTQMTEVPGGVMEALKLHTLDLGDNNIRTLPYGFYRSSLWAGGRVRLTGNPLLRAQDAWHELPNNPVPVYLRWLDLVTPAQRDEMADIWVKLDGKEASRDFFHLLERLTSSADFHSAFLSRYLALRVLRMLKHLNANRGMQAALYEHALTEHCQDNATLRFSDLEVRMKVWKALHGTAAQDQERELLHLGGQCWRLDTLDTIASLHAISAGRPDESLEFALAYRLELADTLDLPIEHDEMLNPGVANLSAHDIADATHLVRAAQSRDALTDYLPTQRFWRTYLEQQYPTRLAVPQALHDDLEVLLERNAPPVEIDHLHDRMRRRESNVLEQLTREAIGRQLAVVMLAPVAPGL